MPHLYTLIAGMVNPKLRFKSRAMNSYVSSHMNSSGSGPHHYALKKQFNVPSQVGSALVQHRKLKPLKFKF
jgi:hypothetical protein